MFKLNANMKSEDNLENQAVRYLERGKLRKAEAILLDMLRLEPDCLVAHFHLARVYRRMENFQAAIKHGRRVLKLNPKEPNANLNLGLAFEMDGREKLAVKYYRKELAQNPDSGETLYNLGCLRFDQNKWTLARLHLRRYYDLGYTQDLDEVVQKIGFCCFKLRDLSGYIDIYSRFVNRYPGASWAYANLGAALIRAKDYKGAVLRLTRAKQLGSKSVDLDLKKAKEVMRRASSG